MVLYWIDGCVFQGEHSYLNAEIEVYDAVGDV